MIHPPRPQKHKSDAGGWQTWTAGNRCRYVQALPRVKGWTNELPQYKLPDGLPDHAPVEVVANYGMDVLIRDGDGKEWTVYHWQLDCGSEALNDAGRWISEDDPGRLAESREWLRRRILEPVLPGTAHAREQSIRNVVWKLTRYGEDVREFEGAAERIEAA